MKILIRIVGGYGLGDVLQFGIVLKHLARYRPSWVIDTQATITTYEACRGLCNAVFHDSEPPDEAAYDQTLDVRLYDHACNFADRPNTKTTGCLHEVFGIPYDAELGRYEVHVRAEAKQRIRIWLLKQNITPIVIHSSGSSNPHKKNLAPWQVKEVCGLVRFYGLTPLLLGQDKSVLLDQYTTPDFIQGAEMIAALIGQSVAFIGIDSGPGHVASSTETPTLICWTKHHPIAYHDPAPNTTHLIPWNHADMIDPAVLPYFDAHYQYMTYGAESDLTGGVNRWLAKTLGQGPATLPPQTFVLPGELPLLLRGLRKIRPICAERGAILHIAGNRFDQQCPSLFPFLRRLAFVREVAYTNERLEMEPNTRGQRVFVSDGYRDNGTFYLCPNGREWGHNWPDDPDLFDGYDYTGVDPELQTFISMAREAACPSN